MITMTAEGKEQRIREIMAVVAGLNHADKLEVLRVALRAAFIAANVPAPIVI